MRRACSGLTARTLTTSPLGMSSVLTGSSDEKTKVGYYDTVLLHMTGDVNFFITQGTYSVRMFKISS